MPRSNRASRPAQIMFSDSDITDMNCIQIRGGKGKQLAVSNVTYIMFMVSWI